MGLIFAKSKAKSAISINFGPAVRGEIPKRGELSKKIIYYFRSASHLFGGKRFLRDPAVGVS